MKNLIKTISKALCVFLMITTVAGFAQKTYTLDAKPQLKIIGTSNIHDWDMISEKASGNLVATVENNKLTQLQWNEVEKSTTEFDTKQFHIWSSSTLYSKEIREQRKTWFTNFIKSKNCPTSQEILHFHQFTESENKEFGLQINRNDVLKTISITQCKVTNDTIKMDYLDLFE